MSSRIIHSRFLEGLLKETKSAYERSDIILQQPELYYSVLYSEIQPEKPFILKLNENVKAEYDKNKWLLPAFRNSFQPVKSGDLPLGNFSSASLNDKALGHAFDYLRRFCPEALKGTYANYCFFRSKKENDISLKDLHLSRELFERLLAYARPTILISFSARLRDYFLDSGQFIEPKLKPIRSGGASALPMRGALWFNENRIDFCYLPHPNAKLSPEAREEAWEFVFGRKIS